MDENTRIKDRILSTTGRILKDNEVIMIRELLKLQSNVKVVEGSVMLDFLQRHGYSETVVCSDCGKMQIYPTIRLLNDLKLRDKINTDAIQEEEIYGGFLPTKLKQPSYKEVTDKLMMSKCVDIKEIDPTIVSYLEENDYVYISKCCCECGTTYVYPTKTLKKVLRIPE